MSTPTEICPGTHCWLVGPSSHPQRNKELGSFKCYNDEHKDASELCGAIEKYWELASSCIQHPLRCHTKVCWSNIRKTFQRSVIDLTWSELSKNPNMDSAQKVIELAKKAILSELDSYVDKKREGIKSNPELVSRYLQAKFLGYFELCKIEWEKLARTMVTKFKDRQNATESRETTASWDNSLDLGSLQVYDKQISTNDREIMDLIKQIFPKPKPCALAPLSMTVLSPCRSESFGLRKSYQNPTRGFAK